MIINHNCCIKLVRLSFSYKMHGHTYIIFALEVSLRMSGITEPKVLGVININLLKTKRNLLYIRNQSVPRCKHFPPRL